MQIFNKEEPSLFAVKKHETTRNDSWRGQSTLSWFPEGHICSL